MRALWHNPQPTTLDNLAQTLVLCPEKTYLIFEMADLFVSIIRDKLKVLYPIVVFDVILMMHDFPGVKATANMLRHHKAMLKNIAMTIRHSIEKVIRIDSDRDVALSYFTQSTLPHIVFTAALCGSFVRARPTSGMFCNSVSKSDPSLFTTIYTGRPNRCASAMLIMLTNFTKLRHKMIIA